MPQQETRDNRRALAPRAQALLPSVAAVAGTLLLLMGSARVSPVTVLGYAAVLAWVVLLPGVLLWRGLLGRSLLSGPGAWVLGAALGFAGEFIAYFGAQALGAPRAVLLWPLLVLLPWVAVHRTRLRASLLAVTSPVVTPLLHRWTRTLLWLAVALVMAHQRWQLYPADRPGVLRDRDEAFQLMMISELIHHPFDLQYPQVAGTPLHYHWGTYVHLADAALLTGVEPATLARVLVPTAFVALLFLTVQAVGSALTGSPLAGTVGSGLVLLGSFPDVFGWNKPARPIIGALVSPFDQFASPTQGLACVLLLPVLVLARQALVGPTPRRALLAFAVVDGLLTVTKSAFPLVVIAGAASALLLALVRRAGRGRALALTAIAAAWPVVAFLTIFGGGARSTAIVPLHAFRGRLSALVDPALLGGREPVAWLILLAVLGCLLVFFLSLWMSRTTLGEVTSVLLAGAMAGSFGAWLLVGHVYGAEDYFLHAGAVIGVTVVGGAAHRAWSTRGSSRALAPSIVLVGAVLTIGATKVSARFAGPLPVSDPTAAARTFVLPVLFWLVLIASAAFLLTRTTWRHLTSLLLVSAAVAAMLPFAAANVVAAASRRPVPFPTATDAIGRGGLDAARWLRAHSGPDDLVATNAHCYSPTEDPCRSQSFWVAGFTERRVLVEGWGFIPRAEADAQLVDSDSLPFWDPELLELNDAAFLDPTPEHIRALRDRGVRWMFADLRWPTDLAALPATAQLRHRSGDYLVIELSD